MEWGRRFFFVFFLAAFGSAALAGDFFSLAESKGPWKPSNNLRARALDYARHLQGAPYIWNAHGPTAFDCAGFVYFVLKQSAGEERFPLPYLQSVQYRDILASRGARISCDKTQAADIVFFPKALPRRPYNHIGLITNPSRKIFLTAQSRALGVRFGSFGPGQYFATHSPECYRNIFLE